MLPQFHVPFAIFTCYYIDSIIKRDTSSGLLHMLILLVTSSLNLFFTKYISTTRDMTSFFGKEMQAVWYIILYLTIRCTYILYILQLFNLILNYKGRLELFILRTVSQKRETIIYPKFALNKCKCSNGIHTSGGSASILSV